MRGAGACAAALVAASCAAPHTETRSWPVMGTIARASVEDPNGAAAIRAIEEVRRTFDDVNAVMSNWSENSELSRLNRRASVEDYRIEDGDLAECVEAALDAAVRTGGAFDPTVGPLVTLWGFRPKNPRVPDDRAIAEALSRVGAGKVRFDGSRRSVRFDVPGMEIDLGGIAKGYAVDLARRRIAAPRRFGLLDLGGNLGWLAAARGTEAVADIRDVADPDRICAEVRMRAGAAVATSSELENNFTEGGVTYGHIMDPRTGRPAVTDVVQATAIHPSATVTDILSTALYVAGSLRAPAILDAYPGSEAVLIVREGAGVAIVASRSLEGRIRVVPGAAAPRFTLPAATMPPSKTP